MKKLLTLLFLLGSFGAFAQLTPQAIDAYRGTTTGQDSYSVTITGANMPTAPYDGEKIWVKFGIVNLGPATLKVNKFTARAITLNGVALAAGDIVVNQYVGLVYYASGTSWQMQKPASGLTVGSTAIASGTGGRLLYESSGNVLGEVSAMTYSTTPGLSLTSTGTTSATFSQRNYSSDGTELFNVRGDGVFGGGVGTNLIFGLNSAGAGGVYNTVFGINGLQNTATTQYTSAFGFGVFHNSTSANGENDGFGWEAGYLNTSGYYNCYFGTQAGYSNLSGNNNVAVGHQAMLLNTGTQNTSVGSSAGYNLGNVHFNTLIGYRAGTSNSGASGNTAVGADSQKSQNAGNGVNTSIGSYSLFSNLSGERNGGFGYYAGYYWLGSNTFFLGNGDKIDLQGDTTRSAFIVTMGTNTVVAISQAETRAKINGHLHQVDGSQGNGKLLVSDANGISTWSASNINTTAGDAATVQGTAGRFRKDNSGTTFTLTNAYITANSIIILTQITAGLTGGTHITVQAGSGTATITFEVAATGVATAPSADMDINFIVIN